MAERGDSKQMEADFPFFAVFWFEREQKIGLTFRKPRKKKEGTSSAGDKCNFSTYLNFLECRIRMLFATLLGI